MQFHRCPLSAGLLGPPRPGSPEENFSQKFFHNLIHDPEIFEAEIQKRKSQSSRSQSSGKNDLRWIPIAEEVLKLARSPLSPPPVPRVLEHLGDRFPHCRDIVHLVRDLATLTNISEGPLRLPPILLLGPPGIGKTTVALEMAKVFGVPSRTVNMAGVSASFVLVGASLVWASGKSGAVLELLLKGMGNPAMILDELDKAGESVEEGRRSILDSLLNLLEPTTAGNFTDEALDWPVDASRIVWIATANNPKRIPDPIFSRFHVAEIREPTQKEMEEIIIPSLYQDILSEYQLNGRFPQEISSEIARLLGQNPRTARRRIIQMLARAATVNATRLDRTMIPEFEREKWMRRKSAQTIGFNVQKEEHDDSPFPELG